jgi:hypothetical protein
MRPRPASARPTGAGTRRDPGSGGHPETGSPAAFGASAGGGVTRVLIDGRNVQRALQRGSTPGSLPTATLVAQLRAAFAPPIQVELIFDGHAGPTPAGRIAPGFSVVFSRGTTADHVIGQRVVEVFRELGPVDTDSVLVVSDDREVRDQARANGVRVQGTAWLAGHLGAADAAHRARGSSIGQGRGPRAPRPSG